MPILGDAAIFFLFCFDLTETIQFEKFISGLVGDCVTRAVALSLRLEVHMIKWF